MDEDTRIEAEILRQVRQRDLGKTVCPSEVARALWPKDWRPHMAAVRQVAFRLQASGEVQVTQRGLPVTTADDLHGPVRLGLPTDAALDLLDG